VSAKKHNYLLKKLAERVDEKKGLRYNMLW